jgi:SAM-dependent methyltransferase
MFKGHPHEIFGCDIDRRGIEWIKSSLPNVHAEVTSVSPPLPYPDNAFDAIISISIFSHLTEESQIAFLKELWRVSAQDAYLFLTVHGQQALERALSEKQTREMISVEEEPFQMAQDRFVNGEHGFILQDGHLTTTSKGSASSSSLIAEPFEYGIAFIPEEYVRRRWSEWFTIVDYRHGAIYDFQDIIVLTPKKPGRKEEAIGNLSMEV